MPDGLNGIIWHFYTNVISTKVLPPSLVCSLMTAYAVADISEEQIRDRPLELGDIMPEDRRLYDKMRPPKYKGKINSKPCW